MRGFSDSLVIAKSILNERRKEKKKFTVEALAKDFLSETNIMKLHNAVNDIQILQLLLTKLEINDESLQKVLISYLKNRNRKL